MATLKNIPDLTPLLDKIRPFTMVAEASLVDLALQVKQALAHNIPGDFVECGVWRGGASFLMGELLRQAGVTDRKVWLFDSFKGLPPPEGIDGPAAVAYSKVLVGEGVIGFSTFDEAEAGIREVEANYQRHAKAAQDIAEAYFDSDKVLNRLLEIAMVTRDSEKSGVLAAGLVQTTRNVRRLYARTGPHGQIVAKCRSRTNEF
jgi:hypothetical protein